MKFECGDLERALATSDLMPEAREHLKICQACRREYRLWSEISTGARELHTDWESADLWPRIRKAIEAEPKRPVPWWKQVRSWSMAAALAVTLLAVWTIWQKTRLGQGSSKQPAINASIASSDPDFLTEQALREVERNENAYRLSIDKLSRLAQPKLQVASSQSAMNAREKLLILDSAIADTRSNIVSNRFNVRLQTTLADLYREKQQTLQELLSRDHKN
jgi:hypothetical protein